MWHAWEERELQEWFYSENLKGNEQVVRLGRRRKENITMYFKETEFEGVYCIHLIQDQCQWRSVVNALLDLRVP